jgi:hypothetical protein
VVDGFALAICHSGSDQVDLYSAPLGGS